MHIATKEEMYAMDRAAVERLGIPGFTLMESAGAGMAKALLDTLDRSSKVLVLCGNGKNGGDGLVLARYLLNHQFDVSVYLVSSPSQLKGDVRLHYEVYRRHGYSLLSEDTDLSDEIAQADWLVDALLGIGMQGELKEPYCTLVEKINRAPGKVVSLDMPSGIWANGGKAEQAVKADVTLTAAFPKPAAYLYPTAEYFGRIKTIDIGLPPSLFFKPTIETWQIDDLKRSLPKRARNAHKGSCGKALIVGGSALYRGAPLLSAAGCLACGIGLLTLAVPKEIQRVAPGLVPEATYLPCEEQNGYLQDLTLPDDIDVVAVGMGLSREPGGEKILNKVIESPIPAIIDADALYWLAQEPQLLKNRKAATILTPHEGEMARLCGLTPEEVACRRLELSREWAVSMGVTLVLKGPFTIVTTPEGDQFINTSGNAGLSKGGSGDLLTGMIAAFLPVHSSIQQAVSNAVFLHGLAADELLYRQGRIEMDISASSLIRSLPGLLEALEKGEKILD